MIRREIYIVNDFFVKAFIDIDIMKFEVIIFDINKDFIIIKFCEFFYMSLSMIIKNLKIDVVIVNKTRYVILTYFF